jgi:hypothetical protein
MKFVIAFLHYKYDAIWEMGLGIRGLGIGREGVGFRA